MICGVILMKIIAPKKVKIKFYLTFALIIIFSTLIIGSKYVIEKTAVDASAGSSSFKTVIIDAGHGGPDGGTSADDGTLEKHINLQIAHKLNDILQSMGVETVMIRTEDISIHDENATTIREKKVSDLKNRLSIINNTDDAVFVSIHQNHYSSSKYSGAQVFYSKNNPLSENLAEAIRLPIVSYLQSGNTREIKKSGSEIYLLNNAQAPAVMVECGFLSNWADTQNLKDENYQQRLAFTIAVGIADYFINTEESQNGT